MSCRWTEKVSLLVDGELAQTEAAEMARHLEACAACQQAREDFLHLRQQLSSYQIEPDAVAQQKALQNIFASQAAAPAVDALPRKQKAAAAIGLRERLADLFRIPQHHPALVGALSLVLVAIVGLIVYLSLRGHTSGPAVIAQKDSVRRGSQESGNVASTPPSPEPVKSVPPKDQNDIQQAIKVQDKPGGRDVMASAAFPGKRTGIARSRFSSEPGREAVAVKQDSVPNRLPAQDTSVPQVAPAESASNRTAANASRFDRYPTGSTESQTAHHVEQAQLLLRSFRNTRLSAQGPSSDLAYDKERSKRLLYQNIVLRREAASQGNLPVEKLLSSLEPILIDIANLPQKPAGDDIRAIKGRMQKKNLVAMLQVNLVPASRFN